MQTTPCNPCCSTPVTVQIPGSQGTAGANGVSAFTLTTSNFLIPAADGVSTVVIVTANNKWMALGEYLYIPSSINTPNFFQITAISNNGTDVTVVYPNIPINSNSGATIAVGAPVTPAGPPFTGTLPIANGGTSATTKGGAQINLGLGQSGSVSWQNALAQTIAFNGSFAQVGTVGVTLNPAGVYLVYGFVRFTFSGATLSSALNFRMYDTTNSQAVRSDSVTLAITTQTLPQVEYSMGTVYSVAGSTSVQLQACTAAASMGAGTLKIDAGQIIAIPLALS